MVISILSRKGGVGKSVTAMHLAALLQSNGKPSAVIDFDPEGTCLSWSKKVTLPFSVFPSREMDTAVSQKRTLVIDTPPNDPKLLGAAARAADKCVIVARTNLLDIDRLRSTMDTFFASGFEGPYGVLLTQAPTGKLGMEMRLALEDAEIPVIGIIPSRVEYQRSFGEVPTRLHEYELAFRKFL